MAGSENSIGGVTSAAAAARTSTRLLAAHRKPHLPGPSTSRRSPPVINHHGGIGARRGRRAVQLCRERGQALQRAALGSGALHQCGGPQFGDQASRGSDRGLRRELQQWRQRSAAPPPATSRPQAAVCNLDALSAWHAQKYAVTSSSRNPSMMLGCFSCRLPLAWATALASGRRRPRLAQRAPAPFCPLQQVDTAGGAQADARGPAGRAGCAAVRAYRRAAAVPPCWRAARPAAGADRAQQVLRAGV